MIGYLPALYSDELTYSWFCRYLVHTGYLSHKAVLQELFCKRSDTPSKEFLGHLNAYAKKVIQKVMPLRKLILQHTMLPQYARFLPPSEKLDALRRMEFDYCDPHYLFTILPRNDEDAFLRYCPVCAQEDRESYGETYWHRKHQLRGAKLCSKHGCMLERSTVSAKSEHDFTLCPAEEYAVTDTPQFVDNPELLRYTEFITSVFDTPMDFAKDAPVSAVLYNAMASTEYMKHSGRSRYTQRFADDLHAYYECMGLTGIASMSQIQKTLLVGQTEFTAVCQVAFFLGMTVEELTAPELTPQQIVTENASHYIHNIHERVPIDWSEIDAETAPVLQHLAQSIYDGTYRADGRPERVSERLIYRELGLNEHRLKKMPLCQAVMQHYAESYEEHWARRLVWAYHKLKRERGEKPIYWVNMRRISGVKERNLYKVIPLIERYTNQEDAAAVSRILIAQRR